MKKCVTGPRFPPLSVLQESLWKRTAKRDSRRAIWHPSEWQSSFFSLHSCKVSLLLPSSLGGREMLNWRSAQCFEETKHCIRAKVITLELPRHSPQQKKNKSPELEEKRERNAQLLLVLMWATQNWNMYSEAARINEIMAPDLQDKHPCSACFAFCFCNFLVVNEMKYQTSTGEPHWDLWFDLTSEWMQYMSLGDFTTCSFCFKSMSLCLLYCILMVRRQGQPSHASHFPREN